MPTQQDINTDGLRQRNTSHSRSSEDDGLFRPQADWGNSFSDPERVAEINRQYNEWVSQQIPSYNVMVEQMYRQYYNQYMNNINQPTNMFMSQTGGVNNLPQMPYYPQNYFSTPHLYKYHNNRYLISSQILPNKDSQISCKKRLKIVIGWICFTHSAD